jgi:poly(hydroxyalkanoate) depolymerase family esterase
LPRQFWRLTDESGWTLLSDKLHVALVMPEQQQSNNQNNCFNWFDPANNVRDKGEALSIKQMVDKIKADHSIDPNRVVGRADSQARLTADSSRPAVASSTV